MSKGVAGGKVRQRSEGGEGVADAEEEVAVAEVPEVLSMVVQVPGGAGERAAAGEFKQDGLHHAVLIVFGLVGKAGYEAVNDEGAEVKLEEGSEHEFKIIKMNHDEKKVGLSLRGIGEQASKREVEAYKPPVSSSTTTLGDLLNLKRASNDQN